MDFEIDKTGEAALIAFGYTVEFDKFKLVRYNFDSASDAVNHLAAMIKKNGATKTAPKFYCYTVNISTPSSQVTEISPFTGRPK